MRFSFRFDEAAALSAAAEERLGAVDDGVRADLLLRRSIYRGEVEGIEVGMALLEEALTLCDALPIRETKVRALDRKQNMLFALGWVEEARAVAAEQVEAATELGDPVFLRDSLMRVAWHRGMAGHPAEAMDLLAVAAARAGAHRDPLGDVRLGVYGTDVLLINGAPVEEVVAAGALALATARTSTAWTTPRSCWSGSTSPRRCSAAVGSPMPSSLLDTPPSTPLEVDRWPLHSLLAAIECRRGHHDVALERIDAIWAALSDGAGLNLELLTDAADVACWAGRPAPVLRRLVDALDALAGSSPVRAVAPALVMAARAAADTGDGQHVHAPHTRRRAGLLDDLHRGDVHLVRAPGDLRGRAGSAAKGRGRTRATLGRGGRAVGPPRPPPRRGVLPVAGGPVRAARGPGNGRRPTPQACRDRRPRACPAVARDCHDSGHRLLSSRSGRVATVGTRPGTGTGRPPRRPAPSAVSGRRPGSPSGCGSRSPPAGSCAHGAWPCRTRRRTGSGCPWCASGIPGPSCFSILLPPMSWAGGAISVPHAANAGKAMAAIVMAAIRRRMVVVVFIVLSLRGAGLRLLGE